jgi:tetratricopeptide (TPR) repeat protein
MIPVHVLRYVDRPVHGDDTDQGLDRRDQGPRQRAEDAEGDEGEGLFEARLDRQSAQTTPGAARPGPRFSAAPDRLPNSLRKRPAEALAAFEQSLQLNPGRFMGIYGAGRAAEAAGRRDAAGRYYKELLTLARSADGQRPELAQAHAYLETGNVQAGLTK